MYTTLFQIHLLSCVFMTGLIWLVQLVHYPSFRFADKRKFSDFSQFHQRQISFIVCPLMLIEAVTGVALTALFEQNHFWGPNLLGIIGIWLATGIFSMPQHRELSKKFSSTAVDKLIITNWIRTILWSSRSIALCVFFPV